MKKTPVIRLVAIDDDPRALELVCHALGQDGLEIVTTTDPVSGLELILQTHPHIVLASLMMPRLNGMEVLERITEVDAGIDVILLANRYSPRAALDAISKGAADYLVKPVGIGALSRRIDRLMLEARQRQETLKLDRALVKAYQFEGMVGRSPAMLDVFARIRRVARHFDAALLQGPAGAGKELAALALHRLSPAAAGPFVTATCKGPAERRLDSELFGHATEDRTGLLEQASGGTLVLHDIDELSLATQAQLERALENRRVQPVGSPALHRIDARLVAATRCDLGALVELGHFRADLYRRLSLVAIELPALRERPEDLPLLERYFVERFSTEFNKRIRGATRRVQAALARYDWPGNVAELETVLRDACLAEQGDVIDVRHLPERLLTTGCSAPTLAADLLAITQDRRQFVGSFPVPVTRG